MQIAVYLIISDLITERNKLFVQTAASFKQRFNIETSVLNEVISIDIFSKSIAINY